MLPLDVIAVVREFMSRATLKGSEAEAYVNCLSHLRAEESFTRAAIEAKKAEDAAPVVKDGVPSG